LRLNRFGKDLEIFFAADIFFAGLFEDEAEGADWNRSELGCSHKDKQYQLSLIKASHAETSDLSDLLLSEIGHEYVKRFPPPLPSKEQLRLVPKLIQKFLQASQVVFQR
jgi:hypothetical protein